MNSTIILYDSSLRFKNLIQYCCLHYSPLCHSPWNSCSCSIYFAMIGRSWFRQGMSPFPRSPLRRALPSQSPQLISVMTSRMRPCSSLMRTSFKSYRRQTPFSALRACGCCPRRPPGLTFRFAEWCTCHWCVQLLFMTSRGWRLSSPMDIGQVHRCSMFPSPTSMGRRGL
jgi:hypothetical protein